MKKLCIGGFKQMLKLLRKVMCAPWSWFEEWMRMDIEEYRAFKERCKKS